MKILITGQKGFLGSNLTKAFKTGLFAADPAIKDDYNISDCGDVRNVSENDYYFGEVSRIYHLAGTPSPTKYKLFPSNVLMSSVQGTKNILEVAKRTGARVLFTSTIDTERFYPSDNPRSAYVDGKKCAEDLCYQYRHEVDVRVIKLFSTYGEGMNYDDGRVIPTFIRAAINNDPIIVYGDGTQIDSFCYVSDMVQALYLTMEHDNPNKVIELGNPFTDRHNGLVSIGELATAIIDIAKSKSKITYVPNMAFDKERIPNIHYAVRHLGWSPLTGLREGLERTIKYFREVKP
jgi:UDP-glucuronate decarboxylase